MKVSDIIEPLGLKEVTTSDLSRDITGCYIGDLLSWVMSKADSGNIWITIMTNVNIVAVAALTDVSCIIVCEDAEIDDAAIQKALQQDITIFKSEYTSYELASKISKFGII